MTAPPVEPEAGASPRWYFRRWEPVVGPEYAALIARTQGRLFVAFGVFVVCVILLGVFQYGPWSGTVTFNIIEVPLLVVVLVFILASPILLRLRTLALTQLFDDLRRAEFPVISAPQALTVARFRRWCWVEGITSEQVAEVGARRYPRRRWRDGFFEQASDEGS